MLIVNGYNVSSVEFNNKKLIEPLKKYGIDTYENFFN
jgi:hypothetical protein